MTTSLPIPSEHRAALVVIPQLTDASYEAVAGVVSGFDELAGRSELVARLVRAAPELDHLSASMLLGVLLSAHITMDHYHWSPADLSHRLLGASAQEFDLDEAEFDLLQSRLARLLETSNLLKVAKPISMLIANEHIFHEAQIVTDMRPVFDDVKQPPISIVLVHNLKLEYHDRDGVKTFYLALDTKDLSELRGVLQREEDKLSSIRSTVDSTGVPLFEPWDDIQ